jgi:hypothetical protein
VSPRQKKIHGSSHLNKILFVLRGDRNLLLLQLKSSEAEGENVCHHERFGPGSRFACGITFKFLRGDVKSPFASQSGFLL